MSHQRETRTRFEKSFARRSLVVITVFFLAAVVLVARSLQLQVLDNEFLNKQADARHLRVEVITANRGSILDRNGEPLAISTPVDSIWAHPAELAEAVDQIPQLARLLGRDQNEILRLITSHIHKEFVYLKRHLSPERARQVTNLDIPGVYSQREYRRYYPAGEVVGHVLGFTNIDDDGQEGIELAYNEWLNGENGTKRVLKDRLGRVVEDVESISPMRPGKDLFLSIDLRIQYLAYRELKAAIISFNALSGSVVVLDVATGEIIAMVNQPSFNPNNRAELSAARYRNRAVTDIFEPGSSIKPLILAAALESGQYHRGSIIDTSPGYIRVGKKLIEDHHNLGEIDLATLLMKSSNVGASKVVLSLDSEQLWRTLDGFGLGQLTASGFPGESAGLLSNFAHWREISRATLSYGYGLSVTPLQLAQAYASLGSNGMLNPVTFVRVDQPESEMPDGYQVVSSQTATDVVEMMKSVVSRGGTGQRAAVAGYRVAGKTGTSWKFTAGGYSTDKYIAVFAGLVPASSPRLATVVVINEPTSGKYYGGEVSAPVFAQISAGALRLMAVAPDMLDTDITGDGPVIQAMSTQ